jgi:hypothetical protein
MPMLDNQSRYCKIFGFINKLNRRARKKVILMVLNNLGE